MNFSLMPQLEELRAEIRKGIESGDSTPLDIGAIKARGRKRLAAEKKGVNSNRPIGPNRPEATA